MPLRTVDLYLIQAPESMLDEPARAGEDNPRTFLKSLLKAYPDSIPVRDIRDFVNRVLAESLAKHRLIKKLVIGSHGYGDLATGYGQFYIGREIIISDKESWEKLDSLKVLAPAFAPGADVVIMACKTGVNGALLQKVSAVLGGVKVHGFTDYVTATDWWLFATASDETDDGNREIVCWPSECSDLSYTSPVSGHHARWTSAYPPGGTTGGASVRKLISSGD